MVASLVSFESEVINYTYNCKFTVSVVNEPETITYYILTNENGAVLTDENGNQLTIRI